MSCLAMKQTNNFLQQQQTSQLEMERKYPFGTALGFRVSVQRNWHHLSTKSQRRRIERYRKL